MEVMKQIKALHVAFSLSTQVGLELVHYLLEQHADL